MAMSASQEQLAREGAVSNWLTQQAREAAYGKALEEAEAEDAEWFENERREQLDVKDVIEPAAPKGELSAEEAAKYRAMGKRADMSVRRDKLQQEIQAIREWVDTDPDAKKPGTDTADKVAGEIAWRSHQIQGLDIELPYVGVDVEAELENATVRREELREKLSELSPSGTPYLKHESEQWKKPATAARLNRELEETNQQLQSLTAEKQRRRVETDMQTRYIPGRSKELARKQVAEQMRERVTGLRKEKTAAELTGDRIGAFELGAQISVAEERLRSGDLDRDALAAAEQEFAGQLPARIQAGVREYITRGFIEAKEH